MEPKYETWLKKYPSISKFNKLVERGRMAQTTLENYVNHVRGFCTFLGFDNPETALKHIKAIEDKDEWLDDVIGKLSKKVGNTRCTGMLRGVKKWFDLNKIHLDWKAAILPSIIRKVEDRAPTKEEMKRILSVASIRDKGIVLVAASSGLRANTIRTLTFGDVNFEYPDVARITVKREYKVNGKMVRSGRKITKARKFYVTFISPEAKKALLDYRKYREEQGEEITDSSPLFTSTTSRNRGKMLNRVYFSVHWGRLLKRAHLDMKSEGWNVLHFHTLKKFAETQFINAGVKPSYREFWLGHKGAYLEDSYFRGEEKDHLREYRKALSHLSIVETPTISREDIRKEVAKTLPDQVLRPIAERLGVTLEQIRLQMAMGEVIEGNQGRQKLMPITRHAAYTKPKKEKDKEEDCQKVIEEKELKAHLAKGYHFVATLPSGKILVED